MNGVWLAIYLDRSDMAIFEDELDALRYALERGMKVKWWPINTGIGVPLTDLSTPETIQQPGLPADVENRRDNDG